MGPVIPVSYMSEILDTMSEPPSDSEDDLEERELALQQEENEIYASLDQRVNESFAVLKQLHDELRSIVPKADMLTHSSALLKEHREHVNAVLARAIANLQQQKAHCQRLQAELYRLEQGKKKDVDRVNGIIQEVGNRVVAVISKR